MRKLLNGLYAGAEWLAMASLVIIAVLVLIQIAGRIVDVTLIKFGRPVYGLEIPSLAEFAGFLLVAASFLALASALKAGNHIRVTLGVSQFPPALRHVAEIVVLAVATAIAAVFTWYAVILAYDSYRFGGVSFGIIAVPLWIPQGAMALGILVFAVALLDELVTTMRGGTPSYVAQEDLLENQS